ncbi:MAG: hypothetical protein M1834_003902 [Cirrosporium novae-zelandiae]|nr:MAG: hypothetical protein M1834_003902 [Cirrosporium novae-zelandiae]
MAIIDDKSNICVSFILKGIQVHKERYAADSNPPPFFLGVNGIQGAGKSTLVSTLYSVLQSEPYGLATVVLSIDDLYLTHADQKQLASSNSSNPLLQHRGQPSTHDLVLGTSVFTSLRQYLPTKIPRYDKSAFNGQGDRVDESEWDVVNALGQEKIKVVIFEGWCVGFRPLQQDVIEAKWLAAKEARENGIYIGQLGYNRLQDIIAINQALKGYNVLTDQLDALIHIDAEDPQYVYQWRLEAEHVLHRTRGSGMTNDEVKQFVDGYYPAYEVFTETLREGIFKPDIGRQLRLVIGQDRKIKQVLKD